LFYGPDAIAVSGSNIFVADTDNSTVSEYTTSGTLVNSFSVAGAWGLAISGSNLFVATGSGIAEYTTSGTLVNASFITGLETPGGIVVSGNNLYVAESVPGVVAEYTTSGVLEDASLITGLSRPSALAISPVPLPATAWLTLSGLVGLGALARKRKTA
jgi:hypothetical protein